MKLFEASEIAKFNPQEREVYENSLKIYRDYKNTIETAEIEGFQKGLEKGLQEGLEKGLQEGLEKGLQEGLEKGKFEEKIIIAKEMKVNGLSNEMIVKITGLALEIVQNL